MSDSPRLRVSASPHLAGPVDTPRIMWSVVGSLVPVVAAAVWFFGPSALYVLAASVGGAVVVEGGFTGTQRLRDGTAAITGLLLGLCLPAGFPCWMAFLGGAFGIGAGKLLFGGLGQNAFNPALLGRAFLQAAFPNAITTWPAAGQPWSALRGDNFAFPFTSPNAPDVVTAATPLGVMKFEPGAHVPGALDMFLGTVAVFEGIVHAVDPTRPTAISMLLSGGLTLGAVYMATDPVTSPITPRGSWIFGAGVGVLVVLIRVWGGLAEGVMYAILLMNSATPLINRATQPRVLGAARKVAQP